MRLIDADELLKTIPTEEIISRQAVFAAPTVDPVRHGNWVGIREHGDFMRLKLVCGVCGTVFDTESPVELAKFLYCPQCGTRMDEIHITWID